MTSTAPTLTLAHLPEELLERICHFTSSCDLHALALVSRDLNRIATPRLYTSITLTRSSFKHLRPLTLLLWTSPKHAILVRHISVSRAYGGNLVPWPDYEGLKQLVAEMVGRILLSRDIVLVSKLGASSYGSVRCATVLSGVLLSLGRGSPFRTIVLNLKTLVSMRCCPEGHLKTSFLSPTYLAHSHLDRFHNVVSQHVSTRAISSVILSVLECLTAHRLRSHFGHSQQFSIEYALDVGTKFSWVATAFLLASTIFQPLYGPLGDIWGRQYLMMVAVAAFAIGSGICGAANSGLVLIFGRIVQGLGNGVIDLFAKTTPCDIIPLRHRGPYLAVKHVTFAIGTTIGPLLGGVFSEHNWRCMLAASVIMILLTLSNGGASQPWSHPTIVVPNVLRSIAIVVFACWERCRYCRYPIMPPHIFSNRTINIAFTLTTIHGFVTYGFQLYLPPYFQAVQGFSPSRSGIQIMPTTLVIVTLAAIGGPLLSLWGRYKPIRTIGFTLITLGISLCKLLDANTPTVAWTFFQLFAASGSGIVVSSLLPAVQVTLPESMRGASAG
ncbi:major facilitator superfamily domain-containing protein [Phaeosphaeria sp. MPI-PUGE-AT-0046c]|nr:major facilitator superfamily domain-containing protein [Phaeosphaeria sp. MPI-PUGE-AT-0046c]